MVTVSITAKAFAAIEATLPEGSEAEARRTVRASISLRCRGTSSTKLTTYAPPGQSYSDVILGWRRARGHEAGASDHLTCAAQIRVIARARLSENVAAACSPN
jgi:hypothetical protein